MAPNLADPLLGPLYDLYVAALGDTAAWALGHLTLLAIVALVAWVLKNRHEVITNLDLRPRIIGGALVFVGSFVAFTLVCNRLFGFPLVGAVLTSLPSVLFVLRSEEHTSELQSRRNLVCRLLLEKKNSKHNPTSQ